jgi:hypothetical protein
VFWTHGDSGTEPLLFAIDREGRLRATVRVTGATNLDWEDLMSDGAGHLWIGDIGNNANNRRDLAVHRVPEPSLEATEVAVDRTVRFRYPDQLRYPDQENRNFDAEALFWDRGALFLLTKHRSDRKTKLYRFPALEGRVDLEQLGTFDVGGDPERFGGKVTAADLSEDGSQLAVLTYHAVLVFPRPAEGHDWLSSKPHVVRLDQSASLQCEGLAWDGDALRFTHEQGAMLTVTAPTERSSWP